MFGSLQLHVWRETGCINIDQSEESINYIDQSEERRAVSILRSKCRDPVVIEASYWPKVIT